MRTELQSKKMRKVGSVAFGEHCAVLRLGSDSLWAVIEEENGGGIALRCAWSPGGLLEVVSSKAGEIELRSVLGTYRVNVSAPDPTFMRVTTSLTPTEDVNVPWWPRDLYPFGPGHDPEKTEGEVLAAQRGYNAPVLYGQFKNPDEGTFLYFQNLTKLNDYFNQTGTQPDGVIGGDWPELGYCAPAADGSPLKGGMETVLSDAFLRLDPARPQDCREESRIFLEHLAAIYPHLDHPDLAFHDWPAKAEATLRDLTESPLVTVEDGGYLYAKPYVDAEVPDSMVQIALLNAIREYGDWREEPSPLAEKFRAGIYRFFDPKIGAIRRYLNTVGENKDANEVDSWYIYHPLQGLARLAKDGDEGARDLFLGSLDYAIETAKLFEYEWPVKFSLETRDIITASREPGKAVGQTDAGGLYAYVMLSAYDQTGEERYLDEAKNAIHATDGMEFELVYQTNLTSWGTSACLRLWTITKDRFFLEQGLVFLASFLHNCVLWETKIGKVREPTTFFGVSCLHNGPYMAPYECYESLCAFHECLSLCEEDLPDSARLLMSEFIRYGLERGWWFYPASLKESSIAHSPRNGEVLRSLAFPVEDLYAAGDPAGQVGQEVYGAGMALAFSTRAFHRLGDDRSIFCPYPARDLQREQGKASFSVSGAPGTSCNAQILPPEGATVKVDGHKVDPALFEVPVGAKVEVRWNREEGKPSGPSDRS